MKLAFVDVETTGLDPETDELIEVCVMIWDDQTGGVGPSWSRRFMPHGPCGAEAAAVNGFDRQVWEQNGAGYFTADDAAEIKAILVQGDMVACMGPHFVERFLRAAFARVRQPWQGRILIDVGSLAMPLVHAGILAGRGLDDLAALFGLGEVRHNAPDDVAMTIEAYMRLVGAYSAVVETMNPEAAQ